MCLLFYMPAECMCIEDHHLNQTMTSNTRPICLLFQIACRMHVCIEDLLADEQLISLLQDLLLLSDRAKLADLPALAAASG
jgi:hypothetical protein